MPYTDFLITRMKSRETELSQGKISYDESFPTWVPLKKPPTGYRWRDIGPLSLWRGELGLGEFRVSVTCCLLSGATCAFISHGLLNTIICTCTMMWQKIANHWKDITNSYTITVTLGKGIYFQVYKVCHIKLRLLIQLL